MATWTCEVTDTVAVARYTHVPMNYFCAAGVAELAALIKTWYEPAIRAVVLTGGVAGRFITHYSVEELLQTARAREHLVAAGPALARGYGRVLRDLRDLPKPVIAGMSGDTMGGGLELALACDIRVAQAGDHRYGLPEVTLGILPGGSGTQRLARLIGPGRALDFMLRGRLCDPNEALALGLVHELADDASSRAIELAVGLTRLSAVALAEIKRSVHRGASLDLDAGLDVENEAFVRTLLSERAIADMSEYAALPFSARRDWLERQADLRPAPMRSLQ